MYEPVPPPQTGNVRDVLEWAYDEFQKIRESLAVAEFQQVKYVVLNVAPTKPRRGVTYYADGTNWNPGGGEGPYYYNGSTYTKL